MASHLFPLPLPSLPFPLPFPLSLPFPLPPPLSDFSHKRFQKSCSSSPSRTRAVTECPAVSFSSAAAFLAPSASPKRARALTNFSPSSSSSSSSSSLSSSPSAFSRHLDSVSAGLLSSSASLASASVDASLPSAGNGATTESLVSLCLASPSLPLAGSSFFVSAFLAGGRFPPPSSLMNSTKRQSP